MHALETTTATVEETIALGARLGALLVAGDFVAVEGPLGAGKTRLAEGIARGLGVDVEERIPSPTFTLINEHAGRVLLVHADLYRLSSTDELLGVGWADYLERPAVIVVEWLSAVPGADALAPADRIEIDLTMLDDERRRVTLSATGPRAAARLQSLYGSRSSALRRCSTKSRSRS